VENAFVYAFLISFALNIFCCLIFAVLIPIAFGKKYKCNHCEYRRNNSEGNTIK
jgi:hypothetical protein